MSDLAASLRGEMAVLNAENYLAIKGPMACYFMDNNNNNNK